MGHRGPGVLGQVFHTRQPDVRVVTDARTHVPSVSVDSRRQHPSPAGSGTGSVLRGPRGGLATPSAWPGPCVSGVGGLPAWGVTIGVGVTDMAFTSGPVCWSL